jgi:hypothetical protein
MNETIQTRRHVDPWLLWVLCVIAMPVVYVLSSGPLLAYAEKYDTCGVKGRLIAAVYLPVLRVRVEAPPTNPLARYVRWWEIQFGADYFPCTMPPHVKATP